ncbi:zinc-ribbon domain-containing protein [Chthonobacter albigriseus]|uniref:zinc-ribbon domain-containing protein n=1 Tax=Chthonobacter albigriseus TaxID=1683161 RepID=UPI0015EFB347|nr:zinc-ribbon domain-containing protein [Chthonobacter albigriseus]
MKISCPNCEATYQLADRAIGATGRKVRCTRCGTIWHALPTLPEPDEDDAPSWADAARSRGSADDTEVDAWRAALSDDEQAAASEDPDDAEPDATTGSNVVPFKPIPDPDPTEEDVASDVTAAEPTATAEADVIDQEPAGFSKEKRAAIRGNKKAPKRVRPGRKSTPMPSGVLALIILLITGGAVAGAIAWRDVVVSLQPDFAGLYEMVGMKVNLRGLEIVDVKTYREVDGATPVLVVEGEVTNIDMKIRSVPTLRFGLRSAAGREVYAWTMAPGKNELDPGERLPFKSRLPAPPDAATDVQVRFTDRAGS